MYKLLGCSSSHRDKLSTVTMGLGGWLVSGVHQRLCSPHVCCTCQLACIQYTRAMSSFHLACGRFAATADSHSSTLLLLRLSELYRQLPDSDSTPAPPPAATVTVTAAAHAAMAAPTTGPTDEGNGEAASCRVSHSGGSISGVTFQHLRSSGKNLPKVATVAKPGAPSTAAAPPLVAAAPVACGGEDLAAGSDLVAAIERSSISMSGVAHNRLRSPSTNGTAGATGVAAISAEAGGGKGLGAYKPWCKDLLLPRGNSGVAGPATLKVGEPRRGHTAATAHHM